jgi:hypothetical protein
MYQFSMVIIPNIHFPPIVILLFLASKFQVCTPLLVVAEFVKFPLFWYPDTFVTAASSALESSSSNRVRDAPSA